MSLNFDGVDDLVTGPAMTLGDTITVLARFYAQTVGEANNGHMYSHGPNATRRTALYYNTNADGRIRFFCGGVTTAGQWDTTAYPVTGDKTIVATYDSSAAANDPILYILHQGVLTTHAVGSGLTQASSRSGGQLADGVALYVGNSSNASKTFQGWIVEFAIWTRILSAAEVAEAVFKSPLAALRGLAAWWTYTMDTGATIYDRSGNGRHATVTGALPNVYNPRMAF